MSKFLTILAREYAQVVKKKTFIIGVLLTPVLMAAFMLVPALLVNREPDSAESMAIIDRSSEGFGTDFAAALAERYTLGETDNPAYHAERIFTIPASDSAEYTRVYDSLSEAVSAKELKYFLVIGEDAELADEHSFLVTNSDNFRSINRFEATLTKILSTHRLAVSDINLPVDSVLTLTHQMNLSKVDTKGQTIPFEVKYFGALIFVMLMYAMIIAHGTMLMRSVIEEKSSRIIEVLISSVTPFQLMFGKIMGLGLAAFTQVAIWVAIGAGLYLMSGAATIEIDPSIGRIAFNPMIVIFFVLYFISGYIMYSSLFALVGSIVNNDKESQSFVMPITLSLIFPVIVGIGVVQDPYAVWVQTIAYIPFFTPTMMLMRVIFIAPTAQSLSLFSGILMEATIGLLVIVVATMLIVWITSRIFRIGILMYGKRPTFPELVRWVRRS